jgi:hypothetical protein
LLGVSGLLVLYIASHSGMIVTTLENTVYTTVLGSIASLLSLLGVLMLIYTACFIWYKIFKLRTTKSHKHIPDWKGWHIGLVLGCITAYLIMPTISLAEIRFLPMEQGKEIVVILAAAIMFLSCLIIAEVNDYGRKLLMVLPFGAAAVFCGVFVYYAFVASFVYYVQFFTIVAVVPVLLLFLTTSTFLITGYLSFLYEIWRE